VDDVLSREAADAVHDVEVVDQGAEDPAEEVEDPTGKLEDLAPGAEDPADD
jgi:hypothetical protein